MISSILANRPCSLRCAIICSDRTSPMPGREHNSSAVAVLMFIKSSGVLSGSGAVLEAPAEGKALPEGVSSCSKLTVKEASELCPIRDTVPAAIINKTVMVIEAISALLSFKLSLPNGNFAQEDIFGVAFQGIYPYNEKKYFLLYFYYIQYNIFFRRCI